MYLLLQKELLFFLFSVISIRVLAISAVTKKNVTPRVVTAVFKSSQRANGGASLFTPLTFEIRL